MTLWRGLLEVSANCPDLMMIPDQGPCSYRPNPWHADPAHPKLIQAGVRDVFDRIGAAAGIGPIPASVEPPAEVEPGQEARPHVRPLDPGERPR
jgi:hypothetical protein